MSDVITVTEDQTIVTVGETVDVVTTTETDTVITIAESGPQGPQGTQGPQGPTGASGSGDKSFEMDFTAQSFITVNHNLGKYPAVTVIDSSGNICIGNVDNLSKNTLTISFSSAFTGSVICN